MLIIDDSQSMLRECINKKKAMQKKYEKNMHMENAETIMKNEKDKYVQGGPKKSL